MKNPRVSVGLPVFNGEESIIPALDSILAQDFEDFEILISDNASTDRTGAICNSYAVRDRRVRYVRNGKNCGADRNHNRVFELSRGDYFTWAAHDIEYLPGMLRQSVEFMEAAPESVVLAFPRCEMIFDDRIVAGYESKSIQCTCPWAHRRLMNVALRVATVNHFYGLARRAALAKTRLHGSYPSSDHVLLAELAMLGEIREIPKTLVRRRIDSDRGTAAVWRDHQAWIAWLNPDNQKLKCAWLPYRERLAWEYLLGAWCLPLRPAEKLLCLLVGPYCVYWRSLLRATGSWRQKLKALTREEAGPCQ